MNQLKFHVIPIPLLPEFWEFAREYLEKALLVHPYLDIDDLRLLVEREHCDLILATRGTSIVCAVCMEIQVFPKHRVGNVVALGGKLLMNNGMNQILDYLESWCLKNHCDTLGMIGRPGWIKTVMSRHGKHLPLLQGWKSLCPVADS